MIINKNMNQTNQADYKIRSGKINIKSFFRPSFIILFSFCILILTLTDGCTPAVEPITKACFFFNTYVSVTFYSEQDAAYFEDCENLCRKYENMLSRTVEGSDIYRINTANGTPVTVTDETASLINDALLYCEKSNGAIDITVAPLMELWNFTGEETEKTPPSEEDIKLALTHVNYRNVLVEGNTVTLTDPDAAIDLGFIAKGYIADRLKEDLIEKGVSSALINLGGNIQLIGSKPDGGDFIIGVKRPFTTKDETMTTVSASDSSFATSGIYERCFTYNDTLYHHILDPKTGYPVQNTLYQVSVLCPDSETADALSTTLLLLGQKEGMDFLTGSDYNAHAIFVDNNYTLTYSPDFPE